MYRDCRHTYANTAADDVNRLRCTALPGDDASKVTANEQGGCAACPSFAASDGKAWLPGAVKGKISKCNTNGGDNNALFLAKYDVSDFENVDSLTNGGTDDGTRTGQDVTSIIFSEVFQYVKSDLAKYTIRPKCRVIKRTSCMWLPYGVLSPPPGSNTTHRMLCAQWQDVTLMKLIMQKIEIVGHKDFGKKSDLSTVPTTLAASDITDLALLFNSTVSKQLSDHYEPEEAVGEAATKGTKRRRRRRKNKEDTDAGRSMKKVLDEANTDTAGVAIKDRIISDFTGTGQAISKIHQYEKLYGLCSAAAMS